MKIENRFNLIEENWIPVIDKGSVSLSTIFSKKGYTIKFLWGTPIQKIAILKLLLAIGQAAHTPKTEEDMKEYTIKQFLSNAQNYLAKHKDLFYLYGKKPFLQMPQVKISQEIKSIGTFIPSVATGNSTILNYSQVEKETYTDAEKALLLVEMGGFSCGGKKADRNTILSKNLKEKRSAKPGTSLGIVGYLHNFIICDNVLFTLFINLFSIEQIKSWGMFEKGLGTAPWENMPKTENCEVALKLKETYFGRLVPLSRYCLLVDQGIKITEGIVHKNLTEDDCYDPSLVITKKNKLYPMWTNPEKRPWRELTAMMSFLSIDESPHIMSYQLKNGVNRVLKLKRSLKINTFSIWSAGRKMSSNAGEQYCTGKDDSVESSIPISTEITGGIWYSCIKKSLGGLEDLSNITYSCVSAYFKELKMDKAKDAEDYDQLFKELSNNAIKVVNNSYNLYCPQTTARQLLTWARCKPKISLSKITS